ncbi:hypothetical protein BJ878DRAFT_521519 [Calycina marina]|uniref:Uncharacterized protein n=1 Tax=Calycina marina TaxID=1763456 RepID=A0A9P7YX40_9HELO|nr:hypothetical protein BJ878DRAFT_521519 [Calycina marina]
MWKASPTYGRLMTRSDYIKLWSKTWGVPATFEKKTVKLLDKFAPGVYGEEIGKMVSLFSYALSILSKHVHGITHTRNFGYWA